MDFVYTGAELKNGSQDSKQSDSTGDSEKAKRNYGRDIGFESKARKQRGDLARSGQELGMSLDIRYWYIGRDTHSEEVRRLLGCSLSVGNGST